MTNTGKLLLGIGVVAAVAVTAYVTEKSKKAEEKHEENTDDISVEEEAPEEKKTILEKVKKAVIRAGVKGIIWIAEHQEQLEAIGTAIGLAAGIFNIISAIRDVRTGNKMAEQVDELVREKEAFKYAWNSTWTGDEEDTANIIQKLNDIHADLGNVERMLTQS